MKQNILFVITLLASFTLLSQKSGVDLKFHIDGNTDTICQLGYYKGKNMLVHDTIILDGKGNGRYTSNVLIAEGVYFLYLNGGSYFDLVISGEQQFEMSTKQNTLIESMEVKGNLENAVFYDFMKFNKEKSMEVLKERQELDSLKYPEDSSRIIQLRKELKPVNEAITEKREAIIARYPQFFIASIFKSMEPITVPEFAEIENIQDNKKARALYNQAHYFDNIDLADDRFLRTNHSVFHDRLEYYRDNLMYPIPDSIVVAIDRLIDKTGGSKEMYKYIVVFFTKYYEKSKIMCMDKVKFHMYQNYFLNDSRTDWLSDETRGKVQELVDKMKYNQCGMKAPSLVVPDTSGNYIGINQYDNEYLVLYFWSSTCGHCKKTTPVLDSVYQSLKKEHDIEVLTVCIDDKKKEKTFKDYLSDNNFTWIIGWGDKNYNDFRTKYNVFSTPTMYLLDRNKKIVGKDLNPEMLGKIIINMDKAKKEKK